MGGGWGLGWIWKQTDRGAGDDGHGPVRVSQRTHCVLDI